MARGSRSKSGAREADTELEGPSDQGRPDAIPPQPDLAPHTASRAVRGSQDMKWTPLRIAQRLRTAVRQQHQIAGRQGDRRPPPLLPAGWAPPRATTTMCAASLLGNWRPQGVHTSKRPIHEGRQAHRVQDIREDIGCLLILQAWTIGQVFWIRHAWQSIAPEAFSVHDQLLESLLPLSPGRPRTEEPNRDGAHDAQPARSRAMSRTRSPSPTTSSAPRPGSSSPRPPRSARRVSATSARRECYSPEQVAGWKKMSTRSTGWQPDLLPALARGPHLAS